MIALVIAIACIVGSPALPAQAGQAEQKQVLAN
jgi:hypothetical protein